MLPHVPQMQSHCGPLAMQAQLAVRFNTVQFVHEVEVLCYSDHGSGTRAGALWRKHKDAQPVLENLELCLRVMLAGHPAQPAGQTRADFMASLPEARGSQVCPPAFCRCLLAACGGAERVTACATEQELWSTTQWRYQSGCNTGAQGQHHGRAHAPAQKVAH